VDSRVVVFIDPRHSVARVTETLSCGHDWQTQQHARGKLVNSGTSQSVRGMVADRIDEKAEVAGVRLVLVPAGGTSANCSRCGRKSVFRHAPDRKSGDDNWLVCACGRAPSQPARQHDAPQPHARHLAVAGRPL
jgi:transposase